MDIAVSIIPKESKAKEKALEKVDKKVYSVSHDFHCPEPFCWNHSNWDLLYFIPQ